MSAPAGNVFRVHLADPGGRTRVMNVPTEDLEVGEHGLLLGTSMMIPWHRVIRYTRETTQEVVDAFRLHTEVRLWLDDGTEQGERLKVRADWFAHGPWTVDILIERSLNVEAGLFHVTKVHVPWNRVLEYERMPVSVSVPSRPD